MKTIAFLLIIIIALNSAIVVAQPPPQVIPAGKPTIIPVPTKNYTLVLTNQGKKGMGGKIRKMTPPVKSPPVSNDVGGLTFFANYNTEQGWL